MLEGYRRHPSGTANAKFARWQCSSSCDVENRGPLVGSGHPLLVANLAQYSADESQPAAAAARRPRRPALGDHRAPAVPPPPPPPTSGAASHVPVMHRVGARYTYNIFHQSEFALRMAEVALRDGPPAHVVWPFAAQLHAAAARAFLSSATSSSPTSSTRRTTTPRCRRTRRSAIGRASSSRCSTATPSSAASATPPPSAPPPSVAASTCACASAVAAAARGDRPHQDERRGVGATSGSCRRCSRRSAAARPSSRSRCARRRPSCPSASRSICTRATSTRRPRRTARTTPSAPAGRAAPGGCRGQHRRRLLGLIKYSRARPCSTRRGRRPTTSSFRARARRTTSSAARTRTAATPTAGTPTSSPPTRVRLLGDHAQRQPHVAGRCSGCRSSGEAAGNPTGGGWRKILN